MMVLRPVYDPTPNMAAYPQQGPRPVSPYENSGQQQPSAPQWQGYPPGRTSPYPPPHSPYGPPSPSGQFYGTPHGSPQPPPSAYGSGGYPPQPQYAGHSPEPYPPSGSGYSSQQGQNSYHHPQQHSHEQYAPSGPGYGSQQGQHSYHPPQQHSPYLPPSQPQYAQSPPPPQHPQPGYQPQIKQEYASSPVPGQLPQTEEERGLMGALAGGAAGGFAGHKVNHGFLGALGGAFAGHKLQDAYKDHKKHSRPSSRRSSSSSSSSSSSDDGKHGYKPQKQHAPPPPPVVHGTRGNFSQSSTRISLDNDHDLIAECGACDGSRKLSSISLNRLLTNDDGHLRWAREGNFAASARNIRLIHDGRFLQAELCRCDGSWRWDQICLDERIENSNGNLQMLW